MMLGAWASLIFIEIGKKNLNTKNILKEWRIIIGKNTLTKIKLYLV